LIGWSAADADAVRASAAIGASSTGRRRNALRVSRK
jgi:hypothetical protein